MYQGKFLKTPDAPKAHTPKKKSRKSRAGTIVFYSVLGSIILLFCIGMALAMNALNDWLVRFEASQPTAKCEAVFEELFHDPDWEQIYAMDPGEITAQEYARYMEQKVGDQALTYIETSAGLSGDKKYIVRCGSEKIATFSLSNHAVGADIPDWQLGAVEIFYQAKLSVFIQASPDHTVLLNGQQLDESHVIRTVTTRAQEYLPDGVYGYRMNEFAVHNLLNEPEVQVLDEQGNPVELQYDSHSRCYCYTIGSSPITEDHRQTLVNAAETYCKYMIGAVGRTALRNCFDTRSQIYRTITENTTWMQSYARYELGQVEITDYYCYSEEYFSARVSMTLEVIRKDGTVKPYELDNTFFVKKAADQWLVWEMINSDPQETVSQVLLTFVSDNQVMHTQMVDAQSNKLTLPEITVPEGKTFLGWFIQTVSETGSTTMELAFEPNESNTVALPAQTVLEPMTLYALFQ